MPFMVNLFWLRLICSPLQSPPRSGSPMFLPLLSYLQAAPNDAPNCSTAEDKVHFQLPNDWHARLDDSEIDIEEQG